MIRGTFALLVLALWSVATQAETSPRATPPQGAYWSTVEEGFTIVVNGNPLQGHIHRPNAPGRFPAVVLVPGGLGDSRAFHLRGLAGNAFALACRGYLAMDYDPPGRGRSTGPEDYNGFAGQDALAAVIRHTASLPCFDGRSLGVMTYSFGIALGAGCLARHPTLPVNYLFDNEGPADTKSICYRLATGQLLPGIWDPFLPPEAHPDFWSERQPVLFIGKIRARYFRYQKVRDHVHGPRYDHAIALLNAATAAGVWSRCNDNPPCLRYDPTHPERYRWEPDDSRLLDYLDEMASLGSP